MSMQEMQLILCRGALDSVFLGKLLTTPDIVLREYDLSSTEYAIFTDTGATSLIELATAVEAWRRGEAPVDTGRIVTLPGVRRAPATAATEGGYASPARMLSLAG